MNNERHSTWSITINNPSASDEEDMSRARQKGWKVEGQLERGENGTPHYQLMVKTGQVRFSAVKKAFPRAHIEPARNEAALKEYVHKDKTKVGELQSENEFYPSLAKFWRMVTQYCLTWEKDRLDMCEWTDRKCMVLLRTGKTPTPDEWIELLRGAISQYIVRGYHVEHFYSPPNISVFKHFAPSIIWRSLDEINKETARQTDMNENGLDTSYDQQHTPDALQENDSSPSILSQEAVLPTLPVSPTQEGDDASSEEGDSPSR